jgi:hypothetical protein
MMGMENIKKGILIVPLMATYPNPGIKKPVKTVAISPKPR